MVSFFFSGILTNLSSIRFIQARISIVLLTSLFLLPLPVLLTPLLLVDHMARYHWIILVAVTYLQIRLLLWRQKMKAAGWNKMNSTKSLLLRIWRSWPPVILKMYDFLDKPGTYFIAVKCSFLRVLVVQLCWLNMWLTSRKRSPETLEFCRIQNTGDLCTGIWARYVSWLHFTVTSCTDCHAVGTPLRQWPRNHLHLSWIRLARRTCVLVLWKSEQSHADSPLPDIYEIAFGWTTPLGLVFWHGCSYGLRSWRQVLTRFSCYRGGRPHRLVCWMDILLPGSVASETAALQINTVRFTILCCKSAYPRPYPSFANSLGLHQLASMFLVGTSMPYACWNLAVIGLRYAYEKGVHRRQGQNHAPTVEGELLKRAFWLVGILHDFP